MSERYLDIWSWLNGYRIVLVDGERFEVLGHFATLKEAGDAKRAAEALSASLEMKKAA